MSVRKTTVVLATLQRVDEILAGLIRLILTALTGTMACAVLLQVFTRYVFSFSLNWSEELARLCFVCMIFLGAAILVRTEEHLSVTTLVDGLPARARSLVFALVNVFGLYCGTYLLRGSFRALNREWWQLTPAMQVPMGAVYSVVFAGVVLTMVWLAGNVARHAFAAAAGSRQS